MQDLITPWAANRQGPVRSFVEFESARTVRWSHDDYDTTRTCWSQVPLEEAMRAHPYLVRRGSCTARFDPPPVLLTRCPVFRTTAMRRSFRPSVTPRALGLLFLAISDVLHNSTRRITKIPRRQT